MVGRRRPWLQGLLIFAAVGLLLGPTAVADEGVEDSESYQEMLRLSAEGNELYEAGRFEEAAETYSRAYDAHPQPILLKNQMITRYLIEECEAAIDLGEQFLATGEGSAEDKEDVEAVYGECALDLAEEAKSRDDWEEVGRWLDFGDPYFYEPGLEDAAQQLRAELDGRDDEPDKVEPIDDSGPDGATVAGWSLIGTGAASLIGATVWYLHSERQFQRLADLADAVDRGESTPQDFEDLEQEVNSNYATARWAIPTLYGVGALATLAGVGLLVIPALQDGDGTATLRPVINSDTAGAVFTLHF